MAKNTRPGTRKSKPPTGSSASVKRKDDVSGYPALGRWLMFVDDRRNVDRIVYALYAVCALLFLAEFFYKKKAYLDIEYIPGFYGFYGFVMCAALVICAKGMRVFLKRPEDYYAPYDVESEAYPEAGLDRKSHNG
jgi:hypothetical protein